MGDVTTNEAASVYAELWMAALIAGDVAVADVCSDELVAQIANATAPSRPGHVASGPDGNPTRGAA